MEMKKQVLSFTEFINESYRIISEGGEGSKGALLEAINRFTRTGISTAAANEVGKISGIAELATTKETPDAAGELGEALISFVDAIEGQGIKITDVQTKINDITYDNVVSQSILVNNQRANLIQWVYDINLSNIQNKLGAGVYYNYVSDKTYWNKIQTDKRFSGIKDKSERLGGNNSKKLGFFGRFTNWSRSFITRKDMEYDKSQKSTKYLEDSGLLGNTVITDVKESGTITTAISEITRKDMFWGGGNERLTKSDSKGFSNVAGNKNVVGKGTKTTDSEGNVVKDNRPYLIALPYDVELPEKAKIPTINKSNKAAEKGAKAYYTLVLYSVSDLSKSDRVVPFTQLVMSSKKVPTGENIETFEVDVYDNGEKGKENILFGKDSSKLTPEGKKNINKAIDEFYSIESILVQGFASKEGDVDNNTTLCKNRAAEVVTHIKSVKNWQINGNSITADPNAHIQPETGEGSTDPLPLWRKVRLVVKGTKLKNSTPVTKDVPELISTISEFNPDKVTIKQICITFEISSKPERE